MVTSNSLQYVIAFARFKFKIEELRLLAKSENSSITTFFAHCLYSALNQGLDSEHAEKVPEIELDDTKNIIALGKEIELEHGQFIVNPAFVEIIDELKRDAISVLKYNKISHLERQYFVLFGLLIFLYKAGDLTVDNVRESFEMVGMYPIPAHLS
jgi:hypothetical protein